MLKMLNAGIRYFLRVRYRNSVTSELNTLLVMPTESCFCVYVLSLHKLFPVINKPCIEIIYFLVMFTIGEVLRSRLRYLAAGIS
jgi:hypothetical protein